MKYNAPYGASDTNAAYINGNPATGTMGSIPPAESIEYDQREIVNVISYAATNALIDFNNQPCVAPTNSLMDQLLKAIFGMIHKVSGTDDGGTVTKLQADTTIYVNATTGDDPSADGTTAHPFKTLQAAANYGQQRFDLNMKHSLTFKCTGAFTVTGSMVPGVYLAGAFAGQNGAASVIWDMTAASIFAQNGCCFYINQGAQVYIIGGTYSAGWDGSSSNQGMAFQVGGAAIIQHKNATFSNCSVCHIWVNGGQVWGVGPYSITGGAMLHAATQPNSIINFSNGPYSITLSGTPAFSIAFAKIYGGSYAIAGVTFSGAATGKKFDISGFGSIYSAGAGVNALPGNIAGTIAANTGNGEYT